MFNLERTDITPADYGYYHERDLPDLDHCRRMISAILSQMYYTGQVYCMEQCIEELAHQFDIEMPERSLKIQPNSKNLQEQQVTHQEKTWRDYI